MFSIKWITNLLQCAAKAMNLKGNKYMPPVEMMQIHVKE